VHRNTKRAAKNVGLLRHSGNRAGSVLGERRMNQITERTRVLLVEADAERRALLAEALKQAGFDAATAGAGERALMVLRQWPRRIEWLAAGPGLPGLVDGWMLADEFHQTHPGRPVLLSCDEVQRPSQPHVVAVNFASPADVVGTLRSLVSDTASPAQAITAWAA
jgi:CheY-like chemotaxis protein